MFETTEQTGAVASDSTATADVGGAGLETSTANDSPLIGAGLDNIQQPAPIEEEELDLDGLKFKVPKSAKDAFLRHEDYTKKTQAVAEDRRGLEAERQNFQQQVETQQHFLQDYARVTAVDDRLQQLMKVDFRQLSTQDPQQALSLQAEFTQLQAFRGQLVGSLTQRQSQMRDAQQREIAKRVSDAEAILKREIKDWSPAKDRELAAYASSKGIDPRIVGQIALQAPGVMVALYQASQLEQLMKDRAKAPPPPPPAGTRVGGANASNTKPLGDVSDPAEWQKRRNERKGRNR